MTLARYDLNFSYSSPVVQLVERRTVNPYVTGSSPVGGAKIVEEFGNDNYRKNILNIKSTLIKVLSILKR